MKSLFCILSILFLLTACTSKGEKSLMESFHKESQYHKHLLRTEKLEINRDQQVKVLLTATYLNEDPLKKKEDERFVVGIYTEDFGDENTTEDSKDHFTITLNGKKPKFTKKISKDAPQAKNISFVSDWTKLYYLKFPNSESDTLELRFKNKYYGDGVLQFYKKPRYVLMKKKSIF